MSNINDVIKAIDEVIQAIDKLVTIEELIDEPITLSISFKIMESGDYKKMHIFDDAPVIENANNSLTSFQLEDTSINKKQEIELALLLLSGADFSVSDDTKLVRHCLADVKACFEGKMSVSDSFNISKEKWLRLIDIKLKHEEARHKHYLESDILILNEEANYKRTIGHFTLYVAEEEARHTRALEKINQRTLQEIIRYNNTMKMIAAVSEQINGVDVLGKLSQPITHSLKSVQVDITGNVERSSPPFKRQCKSPVL